MTLDLQDGKYRNLSLGCERQIPRMCFGDKEEILVRRTRLRIFGLVDEPPSFSVMR
jgi:hypothetical protein